MSKKGFTLIEILIIVVIIALLASVILITINIARIRAKDNSFKTTVNSIQTALTSCCIDSATLTNPITPGAVVCTPGSETYPGPESIGDGNTTSCNGGNFTAIINAGTKNSGTYSRATITATQITYNP